MIYYQRLKQAGVPCSDVITLKQYVLELPIVVENSGTSILRHVQIHKMKTTILYEQFMQYM